METKRLSMNVPAPIIESIESLSKEMGMSKTSLVNMILKQYIDSQIIIKMSQKTDLSTEEAKEQLKQLAKLINENVDNI